MFLRKRANQSPSRATESPPHNNNLHRQESWGFLGNCLEHLLPVQGIVGVGKINENQRLVGSGGICPGPNCMADDLAGTLYTDPHLVWKEVFRNFLLAKLDQAFSGKPAKCFHDSYGTDSCWLLLQRYDPRATEPRLRGQQSSVESETKSASA